MVRIEPTKFEGDERLGRELYLLSLSRLYDEVGTEEYGWNGLVIYKQRSYILTQKEGILTFRRFETRSAASKAWDHLCNKFEAWFTKDEDAEYLSD